MNGPTENNKFYFPSRSQPHFNLDLLHFFDFNDQESLLKEVFFIPQVIVWQIMGT